jgi:DNA topoisomerase-1
VSASKSLVIVESPAKAKTIAKFLGADYVVESSIGHIRDLPKSAGDVPAEHKGTELGRLGVDVDNDFRPLYVVDSNKRAHIKHLKELVKSASELYLATDEDREGESIAWHLLDVLKPKIPVKRLAFHEITKGAILAAMKEPRDIDQRLVDAQEARRILDRLYGYEVSPVLWKKIMPKLSAGRVQSVATRIIVEREAARIRFQSANYWDIDGEFAADGAPFEATLTTYDGQRVATGKDFDEDGKLTAKATVLLGKAQAEELTAALKTAPFKVAAVERKANRRSPAPPFMTSTLQQEASRKLRFSSQRAMRAAQSLYEAGYITYMRTDSTTLSTTALDAARSLIEKQYGKDYLPAQPRLYKNKVKNAQEAHEAIRPAGDTFRSPADVRREVGGDEARLYELIWKRTVASQMEDSRGQSVKLRLTTKALGKDVEFSASGHTITFPGFLRAYVEGSDDPEVELEDKEKHLPPVEEGQALEAREFTAKSHDTSPPARFTEASLVKRLEELGVGRPSTYASIISTIQARGYVWKKGSALVPSFKAFAVVHLLEQHFGALVDYSFTAKMEDELDSIANGEQSAVPWLKTFYFGVDGGKGKDLAMGLRKLVADRLGEIDARAINSLSLGKDDDGNDIVIRVGRYGPYLQRNDDTANIPEDLAPDELDLAKAKELLEAPSGDRLLGDDPETGLPVYARAGRFGGYIQLGDAGGKDKPKTSSILKTMDIDTLTLEQAQQMLSLPRLVGSDPDSGTPITALLGRYGAYITKGSDSRSLEAEADVFSVTLDKAVELFKQPKTRGRRAAAEPIKEVGKEPGTDAVITLREGRFGLYVTDGETNASLRKGDTAENITIERAHELLELRRERGPSKKKARKKAPSKKAPSKKASSKKATSKKASSKKATSKKTATNTAAKKTTKKQAPKKAAPASSRAPASKKAPASSRAPVSSKAPASSKAPVSSKAPASSKAPVPKKAASKKAAKKTTAKKGATKKAATKNRKA